MTRQEQLVFCKRCSNQKTSTQLGIICGLTNEQAAFDDKCVNYKLDENNRLESIQKIKSIRPNNKRANTAQLLIWLILFIQIISIGSSIMQYNLLEALQNGELFSDQAINSNDNRQQIIGILYTVVFLISTITFIQWFRRGYYNLSQRTKITHTDGWAAGLFLLFAFTDLTK